MAFWQRRQQCLNRLHWHCSE